MKLLEKHKVSSFIFLLTLILYAYSLVYFYQIQWLLVEKPVEAFEKKIDISFKAQVEGDYFVFIEFDPVSDVNYWKCAYGYESSKKVCKNMKNQGEVLVDWVLYKEDDKISEGISRGSGRSEASRADYMASKIVTVKTLEGSEYSLSLYISGPENIISETNPKVKVELIDYRSGGKMVGEFSSFIVILSLFLGVLGTLALVFELIRNNYNSYN